MIQKTWILGFVCLFPTNCFSLDIASARIVLSDTVHSLLQAHSPFLIATFTAAALLAAGYYLANPPSPKLSNLFTQALYYMHLTLARSRYSNSLPRPLLREQRFAAANGGEVGGLSNEGNTCFMNLVIQALASSHQLILFLDSYIYQETEIDTGADGTTKLVRSNEPKPGLPFTYSFRLLLESLNAQYGKRGKEYSTKQLLSKMPNGPKQNFFSGYSQEDAQEFYQLVMSILEKEHKKLLAPLSDTEKPTKTPECIDASSVQNPVTGCEDLGYLGTVYVPASQVDPNLENGGLKLFPLEIMSPVDGVTVERIGCLTCGEVGGIRYLVTSGLSLNLPSTLSHSYHTRLDLELLMDEWIKPEIIEQVNCNRCGMSQAREALAAKLSLLKDGDAGADICAIFEKRLADIDAELQKASVGDEQMDALTVEQMVRKSNKSKQIYLSRPPSLLLVHINRSVFDPRTYSIVKNPSNVAFPSKLDLSRWVAEPKDINMDARLPLRKQDKTCSDFESTQSNHPMDDTPLSSCMSSSSSIESQDETHSESTKMTEITRPETATNPNLTYNLRSVISHYGTHNYGHYICYRQWRGTWWRISDELVDVVSESEVLNGQGTFMLFYEVDNGFKEDLVAVSDDEAEAEEDVDEAEAETHSQRPRREASGIGMAVESDLESGLDSESASESETGLITRLGSELVSDVDAEAQLVSEIPPTVKDTDDQEVTDFIMGLERSHF